MLVVKNGVDPISKILHVVDDEIEHHLHNVNRWFGSGAVEESLTPYTLTSGNGVYGSEVLILDTGDTPFQSGRRFFDLYEVHPESTSSATHYFVRIIYGSGTVADAEAAGQYTTASFNPTGVGTFAGAESANVRNPRLPVGTKMWAKCKNATNLATIDVFFGLHEYYD